MKIKERNQSECRFQVGPELLGEFRIEDRAAGKERKLSGYPAKFNKLSQNLGGFRENILPGAFRSTLAGGADVRALINHNPDLILGRTTAGTLQLSEDATGLRMDCDLPDTQTARDLATSIARGDISQGSFRFRVNSDNWRMVDDETVRDLIDVELMDVSVVTFPAYEDTVASVRSLAEIAGIDSPRLNAIFIRHTHELGLTAQDREYLYATIHQINMVLHEPKMERMQRQLALAERE